jgi:hypothetical protein
MQILKLASVNLPYVRQAHFTTKWVPFGKKNDFPERMLDYVSYSATHKPICLLKANMIAGGGLISNNPENTQLLEAIKQLNPKEKSYKTLKKIAKDYAIFNGFALQVIWDRTGKRIAEIRHMDFSRVRAGANETGEPDTYYYSPNWRYASQSLFKPVPMPVFNPEKVLARNKDGQEYIAQPRQIYYHYEAEAGIDYYPIPTYNSSFKDIEFEYQYGMFKANTMKNNMFPGLHIKNVGDPNKTEKEAYVEHVHKKYGGSENAGSILFSWAKNPDNHTQIDAIQNTGNADLFVAWKADARQNIISSHQLSSPVLAGLAGDGGLGGNASELAEAVKLFQENYVNDKQTDVVDVLATLLRYKGVSNTDDLDIASVSAEMDLPDWAVDVMTDEELRALLKERNGIKLQDKNPEISPAGTGKAVAPAGAKAKEIPAG